MFQAGTSFIVGPHFFIQCSFTYTLIFLFPSHDQHTFHGTLMAQTLSLHRVNMPICPASNFTL